MEQVSGTIFLIATSALWITLAIFYFLLTNRKVLLRKGYKEKYIAYLKKSHLIRICSIAILLPLIELLSFWIVKQFSMEMPVYDQVTIIVILVILFIIPFKYADEFFNQKWMKKLAIETQEKIAIDLQYKTLHRIFKPFWEVPLLLACLLYGVVVLQIDMKIVYLFLLIPWLMYFTSKGARYQTITSMKDNYKWFFVFHVLNALLVAFYYTYFLLQTIPVYTLPEIISGIILLVLLIARLSFYFISYPAFLEEVNQGTSLKRPNIIKGALWLCSLIILIGSVAYVAEKKTFLQLEVGYAMEKYIVHKTDGSDPVMTISSNSYIIHDSAYQFLMKTENPNDEHLRLLENSLNPLEYYVYMDLCVTEKKQRFTVSNMETFFEIPFGSLIKFEHNRDNCITALIEY